MLNMLHPPNEKTLIRFRNYITGLHNTIRPEVKSWHIKDRDDRILEKMAKTREVVLGVNLLSREGNSQIGDRMIEK